MPDNVVLHDHAVQFSENYFDSKYKISVVGLSSRGVSNKSARFQVLDPGKNPHWKGTALEYILFNNENLSNEEMDKIEQNYEKRKEMCKNAVYAFIDFYKCAFSQSGSHRDDVKYTNSMKNNCLVLFKKELDFLQPDLLVIQGINNKKIIDNMFGNVGTEISLEDGNDRLGLWTYDYNNKKIYVIVSYFLTTRRNIWNNNKHLIYNLLKVAKRELKKK